MTAVINQSKAEVDRLTGVIQRLEEDMLKLKKQYEHAVEDRNYTGIQLIDRNDELCILYEKCNLQENIAKNGEMSLNRREDVE